LVEYADKLTKTDASGNLTQVGFIPDFSWGHTDLYVRMMGGFWYNSDGTQLTMNSQPMIDALLWQQQFYNKVGYQKMLDFIATLGDYASSEHGFISGKIAMQVEGEWFVGPNFIQQFGPSLNYGVAPFPPPADHPERANTAVVQGTVALIPAHGHQKNLAAQLLAWMESPEILAEEMYTNYNLPTSKTAAQDPRFQSDPNFKVFLNLMADPNATYLITTPINQEFNNEYGTIEEQVLHAGTDPKPLLDAAQAKLVPLLEEALK
jgi:multiple sugar transport system substrate-binding protein